MKSSRTTGRTRLCIAFVCDSFNSMAQRLFLEVTQAGHAVQVHVVQSTKDMEQALAATPDIDLIVCPYLTKRVPESIYGRTDVPCLVVHPGIEGDRGMSSLDWALIEGTEEWGVTILQAVEELDAGPIWSSVNFPVRTPSGRNPTKSGLYRSRCADAATRGVLQAIRMLIEGRSPRPLDYSDPDVKGRLRPRMAQVDRRVDWTLDASSVCKCICASDSQPGTMEELAGKRYLMYGAYEEATADVQYGSEPRELLGQRHGAVLIGCGGKGAVWVSHLKELNTPTRKFIKLPAAQVLPEDVVKALPELSLSTEPDALFVPFGTLPTTFQEIYCWRKGAVAFLWFEFYNGAMSTDQCIRLLHALQQLERDDSITILLLMGGEGFFSNGINLNTIEASKDPEHESWLNINAIDDVVKQILCSTKLTVSALHGNAGAGGAMMALAADRVWVHGSVVLNPSYQAMALFGSEYWTYSLPKRVGDSQAERLTSSTNPVSALQARSIGLVDEILCDSAEGFVEAAACKAEKIAGDPQLVSALAIKKQSFTEDFYRTIQQCRDRELSCMKTSFASNEYARRRHAFVYKYRLYKCRRGSFDNVTPPSHSPMGSPSKAGGDATTPEAAVA